MLANSAVLIFKADRTFMLANQYLTWLIFGGTLILASRRPWLAPLKSPIRTSLTFVVIGLIASTFMVLRAGLRTDGNQLVLQAAALAFLTFPFFAMDTAAKAADVDRSVLITCHFILILSMISIVGDFTGSTNYESGAGRYFGFLGDAAAWAISLPLLVYFCRGKFVLASIAGLALVLTASRGPAFIVAMAMLFLLGFGRGRRVQYAATFVVMGLVALYQSNLFSTLVGRISTTHISSNDRIVTSKAGLELFLKSPVFGSGYNTLTYHFPTVWRRTLHGVLPNQTSTFVQMLSDGGLMMFIPFILFVIFCTVAGISLMKRSRGMMSAGTMHGVISWLLAMLWMNQSATWFFVGSYVGPLVFGMAGCVSGYWARVRFAERVAPTHFQGAPASATAPQ
jgi:hypothetical protein